MKLLVLCLEDVAVVFSRLDGLKARLKLEQVLDRWVAIAFSTLGELEVPIANQKVLDLKLRSHFQHRAG